MVSLRQNSSYLAEGGGLDPQRIFQRPTVFEAVLARLSSSPS